MIEIYLSLCGNKTLHGQNKVIYRFDLKILITGGFGYLGARISQYLLERGHQVTLGSRKFRNAPDWPIQPGVTHLEWNDDKSLEAACKDIDVVIHSAGMNAQECFKNPVAALEFNGVATARLVRASKKLGVSKFVYFSTAHVYRTPLIGYISENTCPDNKHPYATSHLAGENAVLYSSESQSDFTGIVFRLSNVMGVPAYENVNCWILVSNDLCRQAVENRRVVLKTSGQQKIDFIPISYVSKVTDIVINNISKSRVCNIGSGVSLSVITMAKLILSRCNKLFGYNVELVLGDNKYNFISDDFIYESVFGRIIENDLMNDIETEIDNTLKLCVKNNTQKK